MEALVPKLIEQGGLFALAVFAIWGLNRVWEDRHQADEKRWQIEREDKLRMAEVLTCNTAAITQLTAIVGELKHVVEKMAQQ